MHHVSHQGQQFGPYSAEQINQYLAQGVLDSSSHAWDQDANGWVEIGQLPGVVLPAQQGPALVTPGVSVASVTPMAPVTPAQTVAQKPTDTETPTGEEKKTKKKSTKDDKLKIVKIVLGFVIAGVLIYFVSIPFGASALEENKKPNKDQVRLVMRALVAVIAFCWALVCVTYPFHKDEKGKKKKQAAANVYFLGTSGAGRTGSGAFVLGSMNV